LEFWKAGELEVFWSGVKEYRLHVQKIEWKLIRSSADCYSFVMFCSPSCFL